MLREILRNQYYHIDFNAETRLIRMTRTAVPQTAAILDSLSQQLRAILQPLDPAHLLLDMRRAPGNNNPEFEQAALATMRNLLSGFGRVAVLVQTAVGRLHFQRMSRASGQEMHVFIEEAEALRFLAEQPVTRPPIKS